MKTYNEICGGVANTYKGTGALGQCLEAVTVLFILAKTNFRFVDIDAFKSQTAWDDAIKAGDLVPLFELYELTPANTEETFYESRNFKKRTAKGIKITTAESYLSVCSQNSLRDYHNSFDYSRIFEVTEDGDIIGVYDSDEVKIKGQRLKEFNVGIRLPATTEKPPTTPITITYADYEELERGAIIVSPSFDPVDDLLGVFELTIAQVGSGSATTFTIKVTVGCSQGPMTGISAFLKFEDPSEVDQSAVFTENPAGSGIYITTGTGFVTGKVTTDGVQDTTDYFIKGEGDIVIT